MKRIINTELKRIDCLDERWYEVTIEGQKFEFPSVTTYLEAYPKGQQLYEWMKSNSFNSDILMRKAGEWGSKFHRFTELALLGEVVTYDTEIEGGTTLLNSTDKVLVWERWYESFGAFWRKFTSENEVVYERTGVETIVANTEHLYAGTIDLLCNVNDTPTIIDWKTSSMVHRTAYLQLAAYAKAVEKEFGVLPECYIGWFPQKKPNKNGYRIIKVEDIEKEFNLFLMVQELWRDVNKNPKPKYKTLPLETDLKQLMEVNNENNS